MLKNSLITCLRFEENFIYFAVVDPDTADIKHAEALPIDFSVMSSSGMLAEPARLGEILKKHFSVRKLPQTVKVSIGLKYVDIKQLHLPAMPESELEPVIADEATRESIFSFSGGEIDIGYQILRDIPQRFQNELKMNVIVATIPHEVIDSYLTMVKAAALKLVAIHPDLVGFHQLHRQLKPNENILILRVAPDDAELFIWEKSYPLFWRYLSGGSKEPELLRRELEATLEHVEAKTGRKLNVSKIVLAGPMIPGLTESGLKPEVLSSAEYSDLLGIGILSSGRQDINFLKTSLSGEDFTFQFPKAVFWVALFCLLTMNCWNAWHLKDQWSNYRRVIQKKQSLQQTLLHKEQQFRALQSPGTLKNNSPCDRELPAWFEKLRALTPTDIRYESIEYDLDNHTLLISGVALSSGAIQRLINVILTMGGVKSVDDFQSGAQDHPGLNLKSFQVKATLEAAKS